MQTGQQETERELEGALDDIAKQLDKQTLEEKEKDDDDEGKCNIFVFLTSKMKVWSAWNCTFYSCLVFSSLSNFFRAKLYICSIFSSYSVICYPHSLLSNIMLLEQEVKFQTNILCKLIAKVVAGFCPYGFIPQKRSFSLI